MSMKQLVSDARERLSVSRLGKSIMRETDKDLIVIRRLIEALDTPQREAARVDEPEIATNAVLDGWDAAIDAAIVAGFRRSEDQGPAASCHLCVGAGRHSDPGGEWVECSCQRAEPQSESTDDEREALDYLDYLDEAGRIEYDDYRNLYDLITGAVEPAREMFPGTLAALDDLTTLPKKGQER